MTQTEVQSWWGGIPRVERALWVRVDLQVDREHPPIAMRTFDGNGLRLVRLLDEFNWCGLSEKLSKVASCQPF